MSTIQNALAAVNAYPIPQRELLRVSVKRGLTLSDEATEEVLSGKAYGLAVADLLCWLALAPSVSQGGQSYSFTDEQRTQMRSRAKALYALWGEEGEASTSAGTTYGYKGWRL